MRARFGLPTFRGLAVLHPFPSAVNALLVAAIFLLAGGSIGRATVLAFGMLGLQFAIGALNDFVDAPDDAKTKPTKPIARGLVRRSTALRVAALSAVLGLLAYATFGPVMLGLGALMLAIGVAYDVRLKAAGLGWACFAAAFPLLPLSTWVAAANTGPPRAELLLPLAALAGPALQLANGLVDIERDRSIGIGSAAVRLGRRVSLAVLAVILIAVYGVAWISAIGRETPTLAVAAIAAATIVALVGVLLSAAANTGRRERGWQAQVIGIALLAGGWLASSR